MRKLALEAATRTIKRSYDIKDLVMDEYGKFLASYHPRKPKQKRKGAVKQRINNLEEMQPYTITTGGLLKGRINPQKLWDGLRTRAIENASSEIPGSFKKLVSPNGQVYEAGWSLDRIVFAEKWLPNQTCIHMFLPGHAKAIRLRIFTDKLGVVGCKTTEDIIIAWSYLAEHINSLEIEVRTDPSISLELERTNGAMLNYVFEMGYQIDVQRLANLILDKNIGFTARHNPSAQAGLRLSYPRKIKDTDSGNSSVSSTNNSSGSSTPSPDSNNESPTTKRRKQGRGTKEHIFTVFHTGNCLYTGKGDMEECKEIFELFRKLMDDCKEHVVIYNPKIDNATDNTLTQ